MMPMASHLHPDLQAALDADECLPLLLLRVDLPAPHAPLGLLSGSGYLEWGGLAFKGKDDRFGALAAIDPPEDGGGDSAPAMSFTLVPPSAAAIAEIAHPTFQGSRVRLWVTALDPTGGQMIGEPYVLFDGELDRPLVNLDGGPESSATRDLDLDCVSGFEKLFAATEGQRLADASHQAIWPGETGLASVTGIVENIIWGPGDRPGSGTGGGSGGGGSRSYFGLTPMNIREY